MTVKIVIGNVYSKIVGSLPDKVQTELDDVLSYKHPNARHIPSVKKKKWDGVFRLYYRNRGQQFYTGLLAFVRDVLKDNNIPYVAQDDRINPGKNYPELTFTAPLGYEERDYQGFTIDRSELFTRGVISMATGGGKTVTIVKLIAKLQTYPFLFFVLTKDLMDQAHDTLSTCLKVPIGRIGDGQADFQKISVCTIQTAIRALNANNSKFKLEDYKFDDEDKWDEKGIESAEKAAKIQKLIGMCKGLYFDECVSGDTLVLTEKGKVRIDEICEKKCRFVQTYDGNNIVFKPVLNYWNKGERETLKIKLDKGRVLTCTKEHKIYTTKGWIKAESLRVTDKLFIATADVEQNCLTTDIDLGDMFWDIKSGEELEKSGVKSTKSMSKNCHFALVDVEKESPLDTKPWISLLNAKGEKVDMQSFFMDMTSNPNITDTILPQLKKKFQPLWEPVWETLPLAFQMKDLKIIDYPLLMEKFKKNGYDIRRLLLIGLEFLCELLKTWDMEKSQQECGQDVYLLLQKLQTLFTLMEKKEYQQNGLILSEMSDLLGGFAMMEVIAAVECLLHCILKDLVKKIMLLLQNGLNKEDIVAGCQLTRDKKDIIICYLMLRVLLKSNRLYSHMFQNVCSTNWQTVTSIEKDKKQNVYDIEVEDTHCFFGNGILIHNCHHAAAQTAKEVMTASTNAYWRFGGSATPYRESGDEIMIQAMFGSKIVDINASYLIKAGYFIHPYILFEPIASESDYHSYAKIYKECISENETFNRHVADTAKHLMSRNLSTLILVQQYKQGDLLKKMIPGSEFVTGRMSSKNRREAIQDLRDRKSLCMIATSLADEGLNIPTLDAALLAGGGASATRVNQRIGRTLRQDKKDPKADSIVIVYDHYKTRFLKDHTKKIRRILKKEPEFTIMESKGEGFINDEIDDVLGFPHISADIFEL